MYEYMSLCRAAHIYGYSYSYRVPGMKEVRPAEIEPKEPNARTDWNFGMVYPPGIRNASLSCIIYS